MEAVFAKLLALGTKASDSLVSNVHQALVVFEQEPFPDEAEPRLEQGGWIIDYRGFEISYPRVRIDSNGWTVNLSSNYPHLLNKLGGRVLVIQDHVSLDNAVAKAKAYADALT